MLTIGSTVLGVNDVAREEFLDGRDFVVLEDTDGNRHSRSWELRTKEVVLYLIRKVAAHFC